MNFIESLLFTVLLSITFIPFLIGFVGGAIDDFDLGRAVILTWLYANIIGKILLVIPFGIIVIFYFTGYGLMVGFKWLIFVRLG